MSEIKKFTVEFDNDDQICIIPNTSIPHNIFCQLVTVFEIIGYKYWLPSDSRKGYIFSKIQPLWTSA